jgi:hypothetical protein
MQGMKYDNQVIRVYRRMLRKENQKGDDTTADTVEGEQYQINPP